MGSSTAGGGDAISAMIREKRVARSTGADVELVDADHPDCTDYDSSEGGRWVTACRTHGSFVQHTTWRTARSWLGHPEEWCEPCKKEAAGGSGPTTDGFSEEERERGRETRRQRAAERRVERDAENAAKSRQEEIEDQWTHWTVHEPMNDRVWSTSEREACDEARAERTSALEAARRAERARRQGEERLAVLPKIKSRKEQKNRERLEAEVSSADEIVVAKEDVARIAGEKVERLARIAQLRGHLAVGWKLGVGGYSRPRRFLEKGERVIWIPDNFLASEDYAEVENGR